MVELEHVIEVLQGLTGGTFDSIYDLFFAEKRMIVASVLLPSDLADKYRKQDLLTSVFLGNALRSHEIKMQSLKLIEERRLAFENKSLDEILTMHRANMEIDYENIASVSIKEGFLTSYLMFEVQKTPKEKIRFSLKKKQIAEAKRVINRIFPSKFVKTS